MPSSCCLRQSEGWPLPQGLRGTNSDDRAVNSDEAAARPSGRPLVPLAMLRKKHTPRKRRRTEEHPWTIASLQRLLVCSSASSCLAALTAKMEARALMGPKDPRATGAPRGQWSRRDRKAPRDRRDLLASPPGGRAGHGHPRRAAAAPAEPGPGAALPAVARRTAGIWTFCERIERRSFGSNSDEPTSSPRPSTRPGSRS
jgi:hypothetical protein